MNLDWVRLARAAGGSVPYALPVTLVGFALVAAVILALVRDRGRAVLGLALALGVCAVLGALLTPAATSWYPGDPAPRGFRCTVTGTWPLRHTAIDLFNVLVFVPVTTLAVWLLPRWWQAPPLAALFGAGCELGQGAAPALGRVCDGADLVGYLYGIGLGTGTGLLGLAALALIPARGRSPGGRPSGGWRDEDHGPGGDARPHGSLASLPRSAGQPEGDPQQWRARER